MAWRTLTGRHSKVQLSFIIAGHMRCIVDGSLALLKQTLSRTDLFCLQKSEKVVD